VAAEAAAEGATSAAVVIAVVAAEREAAVVVVSRDTCLQPPRYMCKFDVRFARGVLPWQHATDSFLAAPSPFPHFLHLTC
jgi:hypothetical protein